MRTAAASAKGASKIFLRGGNTLTSPYFDWRESTVRRVYMATTIRFCPFRLALSFVMIDRSVQEKLFKETKEKKILFKKKCPKIKNYKTKPH